MVRYFGLSIFVIFHTIELIMFENGIFSVKKKKLENTTIVKDNLRRSGSSKKPQIRALP